MTDSSSAPARQGFAHFRDFYPFYLSEHRNHISRRLHVVGTGLVITTVVTTLVSGQLAWLWLLPFAGYGLAWAGHFFFERNQPATFKYPFFSLAGDFVMFKDVLTGRVKW